MQKAMILSAVVGPVYLVMGLSLLLYRKQWQKISAEYAKNHFLLLVNMFIALILGLIMVNIYNEWQWDFYLILTLTGWGALLKGVFYFLAPAKWINAVLKCRCIHSAPCLYFWGAVMTIIGGLLSYNAYWERLAG